MEKKKPRKSSKKISNEFSIEFDENTKCDRCGADGAADFAGDLLCPNCVAKDVFEDYQN